MDAHANTWSVPLPERIWDKRVSFVISSNARCIHQCNETHRTGNDGNRERQFAFWVAEAGPNEEFGDLYLQITFAMEDHIGLLGCTT